MRKPKKLVLPTAPKSTLHYADYWKYFNNLITVFLFVVICFFTFGVFTSLYPIYTSISHLFRFFEPTKYDDTDMIGRSLDLTKSKLQKIVLFQSEINAVKNEIKDNFQIAINEIEDEEYKDWREIVGKAKLISRKLQNVSNVFHSVYNKNRMFSQKWTQLVSSYNEKDFVDIFKSSVKRLQRIANDERNDIRAINVLLDETFYDVSDLQEDSKDKVIEYNKLVQISQQKWGMKEVLKSYGTAAFGWLLPAKIAHGFAGTAITYVAASTPITLSVGVLGVAGVGIYHALDTMKYQPRKQKVYGELIHRFQIAVDIAKLTEIYLSRYKDHINSIDLRMGEVLLDLNKIKKRENFVRFVNDINDDISSLNNAFKEVMNQKVTFEDRNIST